MKRSATGAIAMALLAACSTAGARSFNVSGSIVFEDGEPPGAPAGSNWPAALAAVRTVPARLVNVYVKQGDSVIAQGVTDSKGAFSVPANAPNQVSLTIALEVDNKVARVWADTDCINEPVHITATAFSSGTSGNVSVGERVIRATYHQIEVGECGSSELLEISGAGYLNINETLLTAYEDASANRDPAEGDSIGQVFVEYCDEDWNHYASDLVLTCWDGEGDHRMDYGFVDKTIAHEYGHHLQWEIGVIDVHLESEHSFCEEIDLDVDDDAEIAWAEGFPDYFGAHIVFNRQGKEIAGDGVGDDDGICEPGERCTRYLYTWATVDEADNACGGGFTYVTSDPDRFFSVEANIQGTLWDLADGLGRGDDAWDLVDGAAIGGHRTIMQIFDRELDTFGYMTDAPELASFYNAWVGRKGTTSFTDGQPVLDMILSRAGIVPLSAPMIGNLKKMPSHGFVESNPLLPVARENNAAPGGDNDGVCEAGEFCTPVLGGYFDRAARRLRLSAYWSYADAWGSLGGLTNLLPIRLGASNLGSGNMSCIVLGSADQASAATYNGSSISFTGSAGWLSVTPPASGTINSTALSTLTLRLDTNAVMSLPTGDHQATVAARFDIQAIDGRTLTENWTIAYDLTVADNRNGDPDGDGLSSREEVEQWPRTIPTNWYVCLDPLRPDSDGDGLSDGEEINTHRTSPCRTDTDGDGTDDRTEADNPCLDPLHPDSSDADNDGLPNSQEPWPSEVFLNYGSDPCDPDTDDDGVLDGADNCIRVPNSDQADSDGDGEGDACERQYDLENWLKNALLPDPGDLLPRCPGGCGPSPPWARGFPWTPDVLLDLRRGGVDAVVQAYTGATLEFRGLPRLFALGSAAGGTLSIHLARTVPLPGYTGGGLGVSALLLDADGLPLWVAENVQDTVETRQDIVPGLTYFLLVNAASGVEADVVIALLGFQQETIASLAIENLADLNGFLIDAHGETHERDGLNAGVETYYERGQEDPPATDYQLRFALLDGAGNPHPIFNESGATASEYRVSYTVDLSRRTSLLLSTDVSLKPAAGLDPRQPYAVRVELHEWVPDEREGHYELRDTQVTSPHGFYHFTNTDSGDAAFNVFGALDAAAFGRTYLVNTDPARNAFTIDVEYSLFRYDAFDLPQGFDQVGVSFDVRLFEESSPETFIPVVVEHDTLSRIVPTYVQTSPPVPAVMDRLADTLRVRPGRGVQLDPVHGRYRAVVTLLVQEAPAGALVDAHERDLDAQQILHFNGRLMFGAIATTITSLGNDPVQEGREGDDWLPTSVDIAPDGGYVDGRPGHRFSTGDPLRVRLYEDGTALVADGWALLNLPAEDWDAVADVRFRRDFAALDPAGASGNLRAVLPAGMGWTSNRLAKTLSPYLDFTDVPLGQDLRPFDRVTAAGPLYVGEESRPLLHETPDIQWNPPAGTFSLGSGPVTYVREEELAELEGAPLPDPALAVKRANDGYYRYAVAGPRGGPVISAAGDGSAELEAMLDVGPGGSFQAHFPRGTTVGWTEAGVIAVDRDRIDTATSYLGGCGQLAVPCDQGCGQDGCPTGAGLASLAFRPPEGRLEFTADGGLHAEGSFEMPAVSDTLQWGAIPGGSRFAHQVGPFVPAAFFMPGHVLEDGAAVGGEAPARLLLEGVSTNDLAVFERYGSAAYAAGLGDYAGLNFRMLDNPAAVARSVIGGADVGPYDLTDRSKYYARASGVSGIHEAEAGSFPSTLNIYGYRFSFTNYGLSYLSSANRDSTTRGSVYLPGPSDETFEFDRMKFSCLGALLGAEIPEGSSNKVLKYWVATIDPQSMNFVRNPGQQCDPSKGWLTLGVSTKAAHIDEPLAGVLGFETNGDLIARSYNLKGVDSRLRVPSQIRLAGPTNDAYAFTCVSAAYFNDWSLCPSQAAGSGFVSLAGSVDMPYFENMPAHLHTRADDQNKASPIWMAGGWPVSGWVEGGQSFFTSAGFDADNRGFPSSASLSEYREGAESYRPRAMRKWVAGINFDYPLRWNSVSRVFRSFEPEGLDVAVIKTESKVDFVTPAAAKMTFSGRFNPVPIVSAFDSALQSNIDIGADKGADFFKPLGTHVVDALKTGQDELAYVLSDFPAHLFAEPLRQSTDGILPALVAELVSRYTNNPPGDYYTESVRAYVMGSGSSVPADNVRDALRDLIDASAGGKTGLVQRIELALRRVEWMLDALYTNVTRDAKTGDLLATPETGILAPDPATQGSVLLARLLVEFVKELQSFEGLAASGLEGTVRGVIEARQTVPGIRATLDLLRADLLSLRARLAPGKDIYEELQDALVPARLDELCGAAGTNVIAFLRDLPSHGQSLSDYTSSELAYRIGREIEDALAASRLVSSVQTTLRRHFYGFDESVQHAAGAVFEEANAVLHDSVSTLMVMADDGVMGLLGSLPFGTAAKLHGYTHIKGDALHELRVDGEWFLKATKSVSLDFKGHLLVKQLESDGHAGCNYDGDKTTEVTLAADQLKFDLLGFKLDAMFSSRFTFDTSSGISPVGMAGAFALKQGKDNLFKVRDVGITELSAAAGFGAYENYLAGGLRGKFSEDFEVAGALFVGRTCTLEPLQVVDTQVADIIGDPPFTGLYVYTEGWLKILDWGLLDVGGGLGYGIIWFAEGPFGETMMLGLKAKVLKVITVKGQVRMVAVVEDLDELRLSGKGRLSACLSLVIFKICGHAEFRMNYADGEFELKDPDIGLGE